MGMMRNGWPQFIAACVVVVAFVSLSACVAASVSSRQIGEVSTVEMTSSVGTSSESATPLAHTVTVDVTPIPAEELAALPAAQSPAGAGEETPDEGDAPTVSADTMPADLVTYRDATYPFQIEHPVNFVIKPLSATALAPLIPQPVAGLRFLQPAMANSDLGELEAADLEIHIFASASTTDLKTWLQTNGILAADGSQPVDPFVAAHVTGVKLCNNMLMAPGCAYYVAADGYIFRLIPASQEGETMLQTLVLNAR